MLLKYLQRSPEKPWLEVIWLDLHQKALVILATCLKHGSDIGVHENKPAYSYN